MRLARGILGISLANLRQVRGWKALRSLRRADWSEQAERGSRRRRPIGPEIEVAKENIDDIDPGVERDGDTDQ